MGQRLGQHFLRDRAVLRRIVAAGDLSRDDLVLEIGPGHGVLTSELAEQAGRVLAVERDELLAALLPKADNVDLLVGDAIQLPLEAELASRLAGSEFKAVKIVANIPYEISSPLMFALFDWQLPLERIVLLMQKEVAERIVVVPGSRARSLLSVFCQLFADCHIAFMVSPRAFSPPPKVESAVIVLKPKLVNHPDRQLLAEPAFRRLVKIGFSQKRKQLKNTLTAGEQLASGEAAAWLERAALPPTARAEELSLADWRRLLETRPSA